MKLFALTVLYKNTNGTVKKLNAAHELQSFGYFQRGSIKEFMDFTSKIVTERTAYCSRASIKEQEYMVHVYVKSDGLSGVLIADHEYPSRVAFTLLNKVMDDFSSKVTIDTWSSAPENSITFQESEDFLQKYQNPKEADAMTKIQCDLDETKIILHNTIETVLQRGEKLDDLVVKSDDLSAQSKTFYKTAKKTNQCCVIL